MSNVKCMMLYIVTDLENKNWLRYIAEEFKRISLAFFDISIISFEQFNQLETKENIPVIYYTGQTNLKNSICNKSGNVFSNEIHYINKELYVYKNTMVSGDSFLLNYDIFRNAFLFLSRYEEYDTECNKGKKIRSYALRHPGKDKNTFLVPVVNIYFKILEEIIVRLFPEFKFGNKNKPVIELSHDVDYIRKTMVLRLKQTAFNSYNTFRNIFSPDIAVKEFIRTFKFFLSTPSYWCFDYWVNLEKSFDKRSVFYFFSKSPLARKCFSKHIIDPSYDIRTNKRIQEKIKYLLDEGFKIGLHGSFDSAENEQLLKDEKDILENAADTEITKIRQHWMNYSENITPHLHNKYFKEDSTIGWIDMPGFRSGCASRYRPYDHKNDCPFDYYIIPLIITDSAIFDYNRKTINIASETCFKMLEKLNDYKNLHVSISWHQRVCSDDYKWNLLYEQIIHNYVV